MHTIRLRVNDKVYKHLIKILSKFSKEDMQVVTEDDTFISIQKYLEKELTQVENGSAEYIDSDELNNHPDDTISTIYFSGQPGESIAWIQDSTSHFRTGSHNEV